MGGRLRDVHLILPPLISEYGQLQPRRNANIHLCSPSPSTFATFSIRLSKIFLKAIFICDIPGNQKNVTRKNITDMDLLTKGLTTDSKFKLSVTWEEQITMIAKDIMVLLGDSISSSLSGFAWNGNVMVQRYSNLFTKHGKNSQILSRRSYCKRTFSIEGRKEGATLQNSVCSRPLGNVKKDEDWGGWWMVPVNRTKVKDIWVHFYIHREGERERMRKEKEKREEK